MSETYKVKPKGDDKSPNGSSQDSGRVFTDVAARIQMTAHKRGLNMAQLARHLKLTRGTFARYWHGERLIPSDVLFALADRLGVDARWLFLGEPVSGEDSKRLEARFNQLNPQQKALILTTIDQLLGTANLEYDTGQSAPYATVHSPRKGYEAEP
jgi:transcriptional regulator with XRE-family HTH domain